MEFTLEQALTARGALRKAAKLPPEQFPLDAFVGMLSDEIEAARETGMSDQEIANMISGVTGARLSASDIGDHYASPEERHRG